MKPMPISAKGATFESLLSVEGVNVTARFPVWADEPYRATLHLHSDTYSSTFQEYFDQPESVEALAAQLMALAQAMRAGAPD